MITHKIKYRHIIEYDSIRNEKNVMLMWKLLSEITFKYNVNIQKQIKRSFHMILEIIFD